MRQIQQLQNRKNRSVTGELSRAANLLCVFCLRKHYHTAMGKASSKSESFSDDNSVKVAVVGQARQGKSSFVNRVRHELDPGYTMTNSAPVSALGVCTVHLKIYPHRTNVDLYEFRIIDYKIYKVLDGPITQVLPEGQDSPSHFREGFWSFP